MSYKERLNESIRRVYGCDYSQRPKFTKKLKKEINRDVGKKPNFDMNEDVDNLILIAVDHLGLPSYIADRAKLIMANMWNYPDNFHDIKYENVMLGTLMFVVYEDLRESVTVDFNSYCTYLFGAARAERNITQMYRAYLMICDLYKETEQEHMRLARTYRNRGNKYIYPLSQQL